MVAGLKAINSLVKLFIKEVQLCHEETEWVRHGVADQELEDVLVLAEWAAIARVQDLAAIACALAVVLQPRTRQVSPVLMLAVRSAAQRW